MGKLPVVITLLVAASTVWIGNKTLVSSQTAVRPQVLAETTVLQPSPTPEASPTPTPAPVSTPTPSPKSNPSPTPKPSPSPTPAASSTPSPLTSGTVTGVKMTMTAEVKVTATPVPSPTVVPVATSGDVYQLTERFAGQYGVDANVLRHIAQCESGFNPLAKNLIYGGLFQFSPGTWTSWRNQMHEDSNADLRFNAEEAIQTAAYVLSKGKGGIWPNCMP